MSASSSISTPTSRNRSPSASAGRRRRRSPPTPTAPKSGPALESLPGLAGNVKLDGAAGGWVVTFVGGSRRDRRPDPERHADLEAAPDPRTSPAKAAASTSRPAVKTPKLPSKRASGPVKSSSSRRTSAEKSRAGEVLEGPGLAPGTRITNSSSLFRDPRSSDSGDGPRRLPVQDGPAVQRQRPRSPGPRSNGFPRSARATSSSTPPASTARPGPTTSSSSARSSGTEPLVTHQLAI